MIIKMKKFLLIGPSGIGKSTTLEYLRFDSSIETVDLDCLMSEKFRTDNIVNYHDKYGKFNFFIKSKELIEGINKNVNVLIAVGCGSFSYTGGHKWFLDQNTICLTGDPHILYFRSNRFESYTTLKKYKSCEFSKNRQRLYNNSKHLIDVTNLKAVEVAKRIQVIIKTSNE